MFHNDKKKDDILMNLKHDSIKKWSLYKKCAMNGQLKEHLAK